MVLVQLGIHGGEINDQDAGLVLLRDIDHLSKARLFDAAGLAIASISYAVGDERQGPCDGPRQRGVDNMGRLPSFLERAQR